MFWVTWYKVIPKSHKNASAEEVNWLNLVNFTWKPRTPKFLEEYLKQTSRFPTLQPKHSNSQHLPSSIHPWLQWQPLLHKVRTIIPYSFAFSSSFSPSPSFCWPFWNWRFINVVVVVNLSPPQSSSSKASAGFSSSQSFGPSQHTNFQPRDKTIIKTHLTSIRIMPNK